MYASHGSPSKAPCTTIEAILYASTKERQVIKRKALKNGETDFPFQVQFSPATVFATYHSDERIALKRLNRVPPEDLNQVFNEPRHSCAAVTGVDLLMPRLCGT